METIYYELKTRSSLIVSPRASLAFYRELGQFDTPKGDPNFLKNQESLGVIYPFYQYGLYEAYHPDTAQYYLPGSSIKGALCQGTAGAGNLMADDIPVPKEFITLRSIYKAQYLDDASKHPTFGAFFDHVAVEMIKAGSPLKGSFNHDNSEAVRALLKSANRATRRKIGQMRAYLNTLIKKGVSNETLREVLNEAANGLTDLEKNKNVLLLGGYKGLLHSIEVKGFPLETAGAVYLDPETNLPHGLAEIELKEQP